MDDCIFCKVVKGLIPADKIHETENVVVIEDKYPHSPKHYLVIPKKHLQDVMSLGSEDYPLLNEMFSVIQEVAKKKGMAVGGFRTVINHGANGGQTIYHLHIHLLGGRPMNWPPG